MKYRLSNCPLCGDNAAVAPPYRKGIDIVQCPACDLVYLRTRDDPAESARYYQGYASRPGSHMRLPMTLEEMLTSGLRRKPFMNTLLHYVNPPGSLIDIGGGWGAFAAQARDEGFDPTVVELCAEAAKYCQDTLSIPTFGHNIEELTAEEKSIKAVTILHTLEHLHDPNAALAAIRRMLVPQGILAGIVPNIDSLSSQIMEEKWPWLDSNNHLTYFTPHTLQAHLELRGFKLLEMFTQTGDFGAGNVRLAANSMAGYLVTEPELAEIIKNANMGGFGEEIVFFFSRL